MAARGALASQFGRPAAAVFADTGFEPLGVYEHVHWLIGALGAELPVDVVRAMRPDRTPAHIREDTEAIVVGRTMRLANPPVFVMESVDYAQSRSPAAGEVRSISRAMRRDSALRHHAVFARAFTIAKPAIPRSAELLAGLRSVTQLLQVAVRPLVLLSAANYRNSSPER